MFLFVARKDSSTDYCMGCRMASYSSDFELQNHISAEELVPLWGKYIHKNMNLGCNEDGYEFHIFKDGIGVFDGTSVYCDLIRSIPDDEYYADTDKWDAKVQQLADEMEGIYTKAKAVAEQLQDTQVRAAAAVKARQKAEEAAKAQQARKVMFEELQKEFGKPD